MSALAVLCDVVGRHGGTERYWETVLPELARVNEVRLLARVVEEPDRFGVRAEQVSWADENGIASQGGADRVAQVLEGCDRAITASVFDPLVLETVRANAPRWIARIHDYRAICPNGNKVFPQFSGVCEAPMGSSCAGNALMRGCIQGPRPESLRRLAARLQVRERIAGADRILVSSAYVRDAFVQNRIAASRIDITPPPLPDCAYAGLGARPQANRVLFAGRINETKGLRSLIRAIALIPASHRPELVVAGSGDGAEERLCRALARQRGVSVVWRGWLSQTELRAEIDNARVVALPSLWPEPFGLTGIEAQARARPVVAYDVGGVREWMAGGGITVNRCDEAALARATAVLANDADLWHTHARAARSAAERYRLDAHIDTIQTLLNGDRFERNAI